MNESTARNLADYELVTFAEEGEFSAVAEVVRRFENQTVLVEELLRQNEALEGQLEDCLEELDDVREQ